MIQHILNHSDKIIEIVVLFSLSILVRISLQCLGQRWIMTTAHTATVVLLPLITYTITNVIKGDIALSLGMVGALSIVRFRNPVRSPLELSVYFGLITLGIAASVNITWVLFFAGSTFSAIVGLMLINTVFVRAFKKPFFLTSFSEGNSLSTLEVISNISINHLDENKLLIMKKKNENTFQYVLASSNFDELKEIAEIISTDYGIQTYTLTM